MTGPLDKIGEELSERKQDRALGLLEEGEDIVRRLSTIIDEIRLDLEHEREQEGQDGPGT
jgi:hypothetical protein